MIQLYKRNTGVHTNTPGLSLGPKLKYEHVYLTSFSKMWVDLASQVKTVIVTLHAKTGHVRTW